MTKTLTAAAAIAIALTAALPAQARLSMNGTSLNGTSLNGIDPNGIDPNGIDPNGIDPNGHQLNGLEQQGTDPRGGAIKILPTNGSWTISGAIVPQRSEKPQAEGAPAPRVTGIIIID